MINKVLVVSENHSMSGMMSHYLMERGYRVVESEGGVQALGAYQVEKPNLVLIHNENSDNDGLSTLRSLKAYDPKAVIIMLTNCRTSEVAETALSVGLSSVF